MVRNTLRQKRAAEKLQAAEDVRADHLRRVAVRLNNQATRNGAMPLDVSAIVSVLSSHDQVVSALKRTMVEAAYQKAQVARDAALDEVRRVNKSNIATQADKARAEKIAKNEKLPAIFYVGYCALRSDETLVYQPVTGAYPDKQQVHSDLYGKRGVSGIRDVYQDTVILRFIGAHTIDGIHYPAQTPERSMSLPDLTRYYNLYSVIAPSQHAAKWQKIVRASWKVEGAHSVR